MKNLAVNLPLVGYLFLSSMILQITVIHAQQNAFSQNGQFLDFSQLFNMSMTTIGGYKGSNIPYVPALPLSNTQTNSVYVRSNAGKGYQAEITSLAGVAAALLTQQRTQGLLHCQMPLGNDVCCVTGCQSSNFASYFSGQINGGVWNSCSGVISTDVTRNNAWNATPASSAGKGFGGARLSNQAPDLLNELNNQNVNYIYLDTIINNSNLTTPGYNSPTKFGIATTNAPLLSGTGSQPSANSLVGGLATGTFSAAKTIFPNVANKSTSFVLGSTGYSLNFLPITSDNRYVIFPANQHNPSANQLAFKYHMANPNIALSTSTTSGVQTIILYPLDVQSTSCQPVIYIGKDNGSQSLLALTYFTSNVTLAATGASCCTTKTGSCTVDQLYAPSAILPSQFTGGCSSAINPNNSEQPSCASSGSTWTKPLGGSAENPTLQSGRMRLIINNASGLQLGYATNLDVLAGGYIPGQTDFTNPSAPTPSC